MSRRVLVAVISGTKVAVGILGGGGICRNIAVVSSLLRVMVKGSPQLTSVRHSSLLVNGRECWGW